MNARLQGKIRAARRVTPALAAVLLLWSALAGALDPDTRFHNYVTDNWNIESGLPQISVVSITQDGTGYMWIGTQNAIARFDGVRFTVFDRQTSGVDTSMANVSYTDRNGEPWFGTPHGALHYAGGKFALLHAGRESAAVQGITEDADGSLLFATSMGVMRLVDASLQPALLESEACYSLLRQNETLWVGGTGVLTRIRPHDTTRFVLPAAAANARVNHLIADGGGVWVGTTAGLYHWNGEKLERGGLDPELDRVGIESVYRDSDGNLWIGTAPMLYRLRPDRRLEKIGADEFVRDSWVLAVYEDREHNLWLGSQTESLFRLWNGWAWRVSQRDGLTDPFVWSVVRDPRGRIVLGTNSNVVALDGGGQTPVEVTQLVAGKQLPNASAYDLFYDHGGRLWIGTRAGVAIYNNGKVDKPAALAVLDPYQINAIEQVGQDIWIGSMGGFYRYRNDTLARIGPPPGGTGSRVRTIHANGEDLLIGTESGIRVVRGDGLQAPRWAQPLEGRFITSIAPIRPGLIGITTLDSGLGLMAQDKLLMLTREQGLPGDNGWTFQIVGGRIYVAGIDGVWRLPVDALPEPAQTGSAPHLRPEMVLSASGRQPGSQRVRCCNGGAMARSAVEGDSIWLPTISGALRLDTRAVVTAREAPNVVVEGVRYNGQWYAQGTLPPLRGSRDVEIDFTGLSFRDPHSLRFRYRLDGYDNDWVDAGQRRAAFYTNLPPGDYRFHVRAQLPDGTTSSNDASVAFALPPRWYERALVRAAMACAIAGLLAALVILRLRRYHARAQRLERIVAERTHALSRANERLRLVNETLAQESRTDPLTGLSNRRYLLDHIQQLMKEGVGHGSALAFLLLDLDAFKSVNDEYGHAAGDSVLVQLAQLLRQVSRADDLLLRWGGEEFLIVLKHVQPEQALETAERIRLRLATHAFRLGDGRELRVTGSIGFAMHPPVAELREGFEWTLSLELADAALYRVKQWGRNGSAGLIAGPALTPNNLTAHSMMQLDALIEAGVLRWLRPGNAPHLRLVRQQDQN